MLFNRYFPVFPGFAQARRLHIWVHNQDKNMAICVLCCQRNYGVFFSVFGEKVDIFSKQSTFRQHQEELYVKIFVQFSQKPPLYDFSPSGNNEGITHHTGGTPCREK